MNIQESLGALVVGFSRLEAAAAHAIGEFFPANDYRKIELIASELPFRKRLDVLSSLAKGLPVEERYLRDLEKVIAAASRVEESRNDAVHSHWEETYQIKAEQPVVGLRKVRVRAQRKGASYRNDLPSLDQILKIAEDAERLADELRDAAKAASIYLKSPTSRSRATQLTPSEIREPSPQSRARRGVSYR